MRQSRSLLRAVFAVWIALTLGPVGCGGGGGGSAIVPPGTSDESPGDSISGTPEGSSATTAQTGTAAGQAVATVEGAATQTLVSEAVETEGPVARAARGTALAAPESVDVTVDLDREVAGQDLFPYASGTLRLQATRTTASAGEAAYHAVVTALTDVAYTDPETGIRVVLSQDESFTYGIVLSWSYSGSENWSVRAQGHMEAEAMDLSVEIPGVLPVAVRVDVSSWSEVALEVASGTPGVSVDVTGRWSASWTGADGAEHQVRVDAGSGDTWSVTVDGETYGPYSATAFRQAVGAAVTSGQAATYDLEPVAGAVNTVIEVQALINDVVGGEAQQSGSGAGRLVWRAAPAWGISASTVFPETLETTIDLSGISPDASGTITLRLSGTLEDPTTMVYTGTATCDTDVRYEHPGGTYAGTIPEGESLPLRVVLAWSYTDKDHWRVETRGTVATGSEGLAVRVAYADAPGQYREQDVTVHADLTVAGWVKDQDATVTWDGSVTGSCTASWEGEHGRTHTAGIEIQNMDDIALVLGRFTVGHFSAEDLYQRYRFAVERENGEGTATLQKAAAGAQAFNDTRRIAVQAILDGSQTDWFTSRLSPRAASDAGIVDLLPGTVERTVNLEDYDPNASGTVRITASGASEPGLTGSVVYDPVTVTCVTDVTYTYTDGDTTVTVTLAQGASVTFALAVEWAVQTTTLGLPDPDNWTVTAKATGHTDNPVKVTVTLSENGETETYDLTVATDTVRTLQITAENGAATYETSATGTWTVTWEDTNRRGQTVTRTAEVEITDVGEMYLVMNNVRLGPYTPAEAAQKFVRILGGFDE